ncbi:MAG: hypothetical protein KHY88_04555 [Erysipelotrichaceae bacterium]|nr:hypothetical protein [Erysipelotrichaceae bacterium]
MINKEKNKKTTVNIPYELHKKVMIMCVEREISYQDYVLNLIKKDMNYDLEKN